MKKLKAILSGANFIDRLFDLRERDVKRSLESASDDAERQMTEAEIRYEGLCKKIGRKGSQLHDNNQSDVGAKRHHPPGKRNN